MPHELKPDARCPVCRKNAICIFWTRKANSARVVAEIFHMDRSKSCTWLTDAESEAQYRKVNGRQS